MDSREEAQNPISVQLTPALLLDCRLNWKNFLVFVGGGILGAVAFAVITGRQPASVFGVDSDILIRMILIELFFGPMAVFFFMTREHISEAKRIILEEKIRNLDMKNLATEAELKLLQAQIEPH